MPWLTRDYWSKRRTNRESLDRDISKEIHLQWPNISVLTDKLLPICNTYPCHHFPNIFVCSVFITLCLLIQLHVSPHPSGLLHEPHKAESCIHTSGSHPCWSWTPVDTGACTSPLGTLPGLQNKHKHTCFTHFLDLRHLHTSTRSHYIYDCAGYRLILDA